LLRSLITQLYAIVKTNFPAFLPRECFKGSMMPCKGEVFVGRIWGSVGRWFVAGGDLTGYRVSNGFHRLRLRDGKDAMILDLVVGLNTEAYRIQARSFCTGSDGLAERKTGTKPRSLCLLAG
jgi:hypothetical protein